MENKRKRDELLAMRDPKAIRKIQKSLKVFKSANKSVIADAIDTENTAVTLEGPQQPDQDDYGYESQEAAALYQKMMEKYSKIPDEPKFPTQGEIIYTCDIHWTDRSEDLWRRALSNSGVNVFWLKRERESDIHDNNVDNIWIYTR